MENQQKEDLITTIWSDTTNLIKKVETWQNDIGKTISNEWTKILHKDQIPVALSKREEKIAKERTNNN